MRVVEHGSLLGYVFIYEPHRGDPRLYKLPGGSKEANESPVETAQRELKGETGISLPLSMFEFVDKEWREKPSEHWRIYFQVDITVTDRDWMRDDASGNEGEVPEFFTPRRWRDLIANGGFLEPHLRVLSANELL
ncbi:MAG: NUDIX domain-containing protein [Patescibacteria group bacterium]